MPTIPPELRAIYYDPSRRVQRPAFQFYPSKWLSDKDLARVSDADQGVWIRILCLLHDSNEYGVLRWTTTELARVARTDPAAILRLWRSGVLRGVPGPEGEEKHGIHHGYHPEDLVCSEEFGLLSAPCYYVSSKKIDESARESDDEEPGVLLLASQPGPIWYCAAFVRQEYLRNKRGRHGEKSLAHPNVPNRRPPSKSKKKDTMMDPRKDTIGGSPLSLSLPLPIGSLPSGGSKAASKRTGPRSSSAEWRAEIRLLRARAAGQVEGFEDAWESWRSALPKAWTLWAEVLKLRKFLDALDRYRPDELLDMLDLFAERQWQGFEPAHWERARGKRAPAAKRPSEYLDLEREAES